MNKFYRTYLITARHHETQETFVYAGKRTSTHKDPRRDPYMGSGTRISEMVESGEYDFHVVWSEDYGSPDALHLAEDKLISAISSLGHCVLNERGLVDNTIHSKESRNEDDEYVHCKMAMSIEEAAFMDTKEYREMCSEAKKTAPWWYEPMKRDVYDLWVKLDKCGEKKLGKYCNYVWPDLNSKHSSLQVLVKEFKTEGYVKGKQKS